MQQRLEDKPVLEKESSRESLRVPAPGPEQLASAINQIWDLTHQVASIDALIAEISHVLVAESDVSLVLFGKLSQSATEEGVEVQTLASEYSELPRNMEQWAGRVCMQACISGQRQSESTPREALFAIRVVGVPINAETALTLVFEGRDAIELVELTLVKAVTEALNCWQTRQFVIAAENVASDLAAANELVSQADSAASCEASCRLITNEVARYLDHCQNQDRPEPTAENMESRRRPEVVEQESPNFHVFLSLTDGKLGLQTATVSDQCTTQLSEELNGSIESAMRECLNRNQPSQWPPEEGNRHGLLCHQQLSTQLGAGYLSSWVLRDTEGVLQAVMMVASETLLEQRAKNWLTVCSEPLASSLRLQKKTQKNGLARVLSTCSELMGDQKAKIAARIGMGLLLLSLIPAPYHVSTQSEVQPIGRRVICAPFDSRLEKCFVEPGDVIHKGDVLARLDGREIELELAQVEADLNAALKQHDGLVASHDMGEARVAHYEAEQLRARHQLLEQRKNNLELVSPVKGVLISGDLQRVEGRQMEVGESLFEIAPLDEMRVEVAIPEEDIRYVKEGMDVQVRLSAIPFETWSGVISRIHPAAEIRGSKNVFVAQVEMGGASLEFRPGMRGRASIKTSWKPICWSLLHKPFARCLRWVRC